MVLNPDDPLLQILACPLDKGPLHLLTPDPDAVVDELVSGPVLYNPRLQRSYPVTDGIPQLLPSSGTQVDGDTHEQLLKRIDS